MKVIFYDVDQGSCCHIITPNNMHILVDVGSKYDESIVEYIQKKYIWLFNLNGLIVTHPHEDHIYDLPNLQKLMKPEVFLRNKDAFDVIPAERNYVHQMIAYTVNEMNREYCDPLWNCRDPFDEYVNGGVKFDVIWPKTEWTTKNDLNTFSCVIIMEYAGVKFVLTGDNPKEILQRMVDVNYQNIRNKIRNANVLLAPHHGRENGYCEDFFQLVNPELTVVSDKPIEHGSQEHTAALYKGRGKWVGYERRYVLTTRKDGTIVFDVGYHGYFTCLHQENY